MAERGTSNSSRRAGSSSAGGGRNGSRSSTSSARCSTVFPSSSLSSSSSTNTTYPVDDPHSSSNPSQHLYPAAGRFNHSLLSVGSRISLSEQFATTRKEYEFGFDDAASFVAQSEFDDEEEEGDRDDESEDADRGSDGEDSTLTVGPDGGDGLDGVAVVPPPPISQQQKQEEDEEGYKVPVDAGERQDRLSGERVRRSHYELLCLPDGGEATQRDVRRAYFRMYDILRSERLPAKYQDMAEGYFRDAQAAFETLIGDEAGKREYDFALLDERDETSSESENAVRRGDGKTATARRTGPRFVRKLRRQQEQQSTEVGVQLDAQHLFSQDRGPPRRRQALPVALSLTSNQTIRLPAVSKVLEPRARALRLAIRGPASTTQAGSDEQDLELYCTPPTLTGCFSVFATNVRSAYLAPVGALGQYRNLISDTLPKDRPLEWTSTHVAPLVNLKFRQELFLREPGLSKTALRRTLPDAVVEFETDQLSAASVTARVSHALRPDESTEEGGDDEPVHIEASASVSRSWRAGSYATRLGLAAHKRLPAAAGSGILFACADSGTSAPWHAPGSSPSPTSWRRYMDELSRSLARGLMPYYHSPATVEVGYRFSASADDADAMGAPSGKPFTRQARSGLRRLHDDVDLVDVGKGGSWTVSGAFSAAGVAGYLRYGRDLFASCPPSTSPSEDGASPPPRASWKDRLGGLRMEAELTTHKTKAAAVSFRGLAKIGNSSKLGLELGAGGSGGVVLSVYFSQRNNRRFVVPVMLLGRWYDDSHATSLLLFWSAFLPALGLVAVDYVLAASRRAAAGVDTSRPRGGGARKKGKRAVASKSYQQEEELVQRQREADAHRRAEADALVALLAEPVQHRQRQRRDCGGLVILGAKYGAVSPAGVKEEEGVESADVTVAVAALVEEEAGGGGGGVLLIPEGLRKSKLLGFWDPMPGRTKALVVRYAYGGREGTRAVSGREELRLP